MMNRGVFRPIDYRGASICTRIIANRVVAKEPPASRPVGFKPSVVLHSCPTNYPIFEGFILTWTSIWKCGM